MQRLRAITSPSTIGILRKPRNTIEYKISKRKLEDTLRFIRLRLSLHFSSHSVDTLFNTRARNGPGSRRFPYLETYDRRCFMCTIKIRENDELISIDREVDRWIRRSRLVQDLARALPGLPVHIDPTLAFGMHRAII